MRFLTPLRFSLTALRQATYKHHMFVPVAVHEQGVFETVRIDP